MMTNGVFKAGAYRFIIHAVHICYVFFVRAAAGVYREYILLDRRIQLWQR